MSLSRPRTHWLSLGCSAPGLHRFPLWPPLEKPHSCFQPTVYSAGHGSATRNRLCPPSTGPILWGTSLCCQRSCCGSLEVSPISSPILKPATGPQVSLPTPDGNSLSSAFASIPPLLSAWSLSPPTARPFLLNSWNPTHQHVTGANIWPFSRNPSLLPMAASCSLCSFKAKVLPKVYYLRTHPPPSLCSSY